MSRHRWAVLGVCLMVCVGLQWFLTYPTMISDEIMSSHPYVADPDGGSQLIGEQNRHLMLMFEIWPRWHVLYPWLPLIIVAPAITLVVPRWTRLLIVSMGYGVAMSFAFAFVFARTGNRSRSELASIDAVVAVWPATAVIIVILTTATSLGTAIISALLMRVILRRTPNATK